MSRQEPGATPLTQVPPPIQQQQQQQHPMPSQANAISGSNSYYSTTAAKSMVVVALIATRQGGNHTSMARIRMHLEREGGFRCVMTDHETLGTPARCASWLKETGAVCALGVHAYRSGALLVGSSIRYALILGGTDVNEFCKDPQACDIMRAATMGAAVLVGFHEGMLARADSSFARGSSAVRRVIPQAVDIPRLPRPRPRPQPQPQPQTRTQTHSQLQTHTDGILSSISATSTSATVTDTAATAASFDLRAYICAEWPGVGPGPDAVILLLVAGLRPVKDVLYLRASVEAWHTVDARVYMCIIGPSLDATYAESVRMATRESSAIILLPPIPRQHLLVAMQQAQCVVNSSRSEGSCGALLEAMAVGVPVCARRIEANAELIREGETGILFDDPEEFVQKCREYGIDKETRPPRLSAVVRAARTRVNTQYTPAKEGRAYIDIVENVLLAS